MPSLLPVDKKLAGNLARSVICLQNAGGFIANEKITPFHLAFLNPIILTVSSFVCSFALKQRKAESSRCGVIAEILAPLDQVLLLAGRGASLISSVRLCLEPDFALHTLLIGTPASRATVRYCVAQALC